MKYDDVYTYIGQMGRFQKLVSAAIFFFSCFTLDATQMIFVGADMKHWCLVPELENLTYEQQKIVASPFVGYQVGRPAELRNHSAVKSTTVNYYNHTDHNMTSSVTSEVLEYSSCTQFNINYSAYSSEVLASWDRGSFLEDTTTVACHRWVYDQSIFSSTIVSRFNLVCGNEYLNQLASTLYMIGSLIGGVVSGLMADKIGRKPSILIFLLVKIVGLLMSALSPVYIGLAIGRFIMGVGSSACFVSAYILLMEIVGPDYRSFAGCGIQIFTSVGFLLQPLFAVLTRNDMTFQLTFVIPSIMTFAFIIMVPESPRWLIVVGKYKEADRVFRLMCRINGTSLPVDYDVRHIEKDDGEQKNYTVLLQSKRLRCRTIIMNIVWFTSSLIYYAMALNVGYLPGDIFVNTVLSSGLEIPAIIGCIFLLDWKRLGRRGSAVGSFMLTGVCLFLCIPMELHGYDMTVTMLAVVGKAIAVINYSVLFVYASEIFPTEVRNAAMGVAQMFSCSGGVVSPYIGKPMTDAWKPLPSLVLCITAVLSGLLCIVLPETRGRALFDTVEQAERRDNHGEQANHENGMLVKKVDANAPAPSDTKHEEGKEISLHLVEAPETNVDEMKYEENTNMDLTSLALPSPARSR